MKISLFNKLVIFCALLLLFRYSITQHFSFLFLFWNLFLAWIPLFIVRRIKQGDNKIRKQMLLLLSVLFLPNAPYILTDLFHLQKGLHVPLWLDLILILSFAFLGLFYFLMASEKIISVVVQLYGSRVSGVSKIALAGLTGYGIYLGRYLRFNSWDLLSNPGSLARGMYYSLFDGTTNKETASITLAFSVFLYLIFEIYLSYKSKAISNELF